MDENGNPVEKASLKVKSRDVGFQTTKYGEFWRILLPGIYKLEVHCQLFLHNCNLMIFVYVLPKQIMSIYSMHLFLHINTIFYNTYNQYIHFLGLC